jgi:hypothetical protein
MFRDSSVSWSICWLKGEVPVLNYVSGQLHAPVALPPGKESSATSEWEAAWAP